MSESVYVFMYLYACKSDKREKERTPWRRTNELLRRMLLFVSTIQQYYILQTDFDLPRSQNSRFCPSNIGKQNVTTEDDKNFLMFWAWSFENCWIFYTYLATILKNYQGSLQKKKLNSCFCLLILGKKMKTKNFPHLISYYFRIEQD